MNLLRRRILPSILLLAASAGICLAADPAAIREEARSGLANRAPGVVRALPAEWTMFAPEAGRFSVRLPALPALSQKAAAVGAATVVNHLARVLVAEPPAVFTVDYRDVPEAWAREGLMPYLEQAASAEVFALAGLRMTERKGIAVAGGSGLPEVPGIEVSLEDPKGMKGKARMLVAGTRLYSLTVFWEQGAKEGEALADRFFAGFALGGGPAGAPAGLPVSRPGGK